MDISEHCPNCGASYYAEDEGCNACGHGQDAPPEDVCDFVPDEATLRSGVVARREFIYVCPDHDCQVFQGHYGWSCRHNHPVPMPDEVEVVRVSTARGAVSDG